MSKAEDESGIWDLEEQKERAAYLFPGKSGLWVIRECQLELVAGVIG